MLKIDELMTAELALDRLEKKADDVFGKLEQIISTIESLKEMADTLPTPQDLQKLTDTAEVCRDRLTEVADANNDLPNIGYFQRAIEAAQQLQGVLVEVEEDA